MPLTKLGRGGGVALAVDLLNSWDELDDPPELLSVRWLRRYLAFHGFPAAAAGEGGASGPRSAVLRGSAGPPQRERFGREWRFRHGPDEGPDLRFLAAPAALGLLDAIREHGLSRFGHCDAAPKRERPCSRIAS